MGKNDKRKLLKSAIIGKIVMIMLVVIDQLTKQLALIHLKDKAPIVLIEGVFELYYLENIGSAFGLFKGQRWLFLLSVVFVTIVVIYSYCKLPMTKRYKPLRVLCVGILAGAFGNMIDRIVHGFVIDFFYFSLIDFPIFNVADIYIVVSTILLILLMLFYYKEADFEFLSKDK